MKSFSILFIAALLLSYVFSTTLTDKKRCQTKCEIHYGASTQDIKCNTKKGGQTIRNNKCYLDYKVALGECKYRC